MRSDDSMVVSPKQWPSTGPDRALTLRWFNLRIAFGRSQPPPREVSVCSAVTELETAVWRAALAMRAADFGAHLRERSPRGARHAEAGSLAQWELGHGPPLHRTCFALEFCEITGHQYDRQLEAGYIRWVSRALDAVGSYAARCWGDIRLDLRIEVVDEDDLGAIHSRYIPVTRHGPVDQHVEVFEGLGDGETRDALLEMVHEVLATDSYARALETSRDLRRNGGRRALEKFGRRIRTRLEEIDQDADNLLASGDSMRQYVHEAYRDAPPGVCDAGQAVQAFNELVQAMLWTLLGAAEQADAPKPYTTLPAACRLRRVGRHHDLSTTMQEARMVVHASPPSPFVIAAGTPVDGIYLSRSQLVQLMFEPLVDVTGRSLSALEAAG